MKNKKIREPRDAERFQYQPELEKPDDVSTELAKHGKDINVEGQTSKKAKDKIAEFLVKAQDSPKKTQKELEAKGYEALPSAAFSNYEDVTTKDGKLQGGAASTFTAQYIKNFDDDPNYDVAIGEYGDGYTVYLKNI